MVGYQKNCGLQAWQSLLDASADLYFLCFKMPPVLCRGALRLITQRRQQFGLVFGHQGIG